MGPPSTSPGAAVPDEAPFTGPPSRTDWLLLNMMQDYQTQGRNEYAALLTDSIGPGMETTTFPGNALVPGMVVAVQPGKLLLVSLTGTTTPQQWIFHVLGGTQEAMPGVSGHVNNYFTYATLQRWAQLQDFLKTWPRDHRLVFIGHSFGAAMALIMGNMAANPVAGAFTNVGCYVAACPKVGDDEFARHIDPLTWRLESFGDPVVVIPPVTTLALNDWFGIPIPGPATWAHGGFVQNLDEAGNIGEGPSGMTGVEAAALASSSPQEFAKGHISPTYVTRLALEWVGPEYLTPGAKGYQDPSILQRALGADPLVPSPPPAEPPPPPGPAPAGGAPMPVVFPVGNPPPAFRILFKFNEGIWGWEEEYYFFYPDVDLATWPTAQNDAAELASARREILTNKATLWGYRIQLAGSKTAGGSEFVTDLGRECGPGQVADKGVAVMGGEPVWDGVICLLYDAQYVYSRKLILRGIVSDWLQWDPGLKAALKVPGDAEVENYLEAVMGTGSGVNLGRFQGEGSLFGRARDPIAKNEIFIERAALNPSGCGTDIYTREPPIWTAGSAVHIHQAGSCGDSCSVPGMSGDTCVLSMPVEPVPPETLFKTTVGRRPACCVAGLDLKLPAKSTIYNIKMGFYGIRHAETGRMVKRDTGGSMGAGRGRARRCARR